MLRQLACVLIAIAAVFWVALTSIAQETKPTRAAKPARDARPAKPRLDRKAWRKAFLKRLNEIPEGEDPAKDPELVKLVTGYTWHAVPQALALLDCSDPEIETKEGYSRAKLHLRVRLIARVMAKTRKASGLAGILDRVTGWTAEDWQSYRETGRIMVEATAIFRKHGWATAEPKFLEAAQRYRGLGRTDRLAIALNRAGGCLWHRGRFWQAKSLHERALALREKICNEADIAGSLNNLGNIYYSLGRFEKALEYHRRALELLKKIGNSIDIAGSLNSLGSVYYSLGRFEKALVYYSRALVLREKIGNEAKISGSLNNLGSVYYLLGRFEKALEYHRRALALREKIGNEANIAGSLNNLGALYYSLGRFEKALEYHRRALALREKISNPADIAASLNNLGGVFDSLGQYERARKAHERALALREKIGNEANIAVSLNNLGNVYESLGRYEEALDFHRRALALREKIGNPADIACSLNNLGGVFDSLGQYEKALEYHRRALALREKIGNEANIAVSLNNLGNLLSSLGQYEKAREYHCRALELNEKIGSEADIAASLNNLGNVYDSFGRYEEALGYYRRALALFEKIGNESEIAVSLNNLGNVYSSLGQYEKVREYHERALALVEKIGNTADIARSLGNIGNVFFFLGQFGKAREYHERALALKEKIGNEADIAGLLNNLGHVYNKIGRFEKARKAHERALSLLEKIGNDAQIARSQFNLALVLLRLRKLLAARAHSARALDKLRTVRERLVADHDRMAFMEKWQWSLFPALDAALDDKASEIVPDCALAIRTVETLRGMATADLLQASLRGVKLPAGSKAAARARRFSDEVAALEVRIKADWKKLGTSGIEKLRHKQRTLEAKWQDAMDHLQRECPEYVQLQRPRPIMLESLKQALPMQTAYVAFALGNEKSMLILVDRDGLQHWELHRRNLIEKAVKAHLTRLEHFTKNSEVLETGHNLFKILLYPAWKSLSRYRTWFVSTEGLLNGLPLETLITEEARSGCRNASYLFKRVAVVYVHSTTVWDIHCKRAVVREETYASGEDARPSRMLVMADPVNPGESEWASEGENREFVFAETRDGFGRLPHTRKEALSVLHRFSDLGETLGGKWHFEVDGRKLELEDFLEAMGELRRSASTARHVKVTGPNADVLLGRLASKKMLLDMQLDRYRFLHIAAHGYLNENNPGLSGLILSPSKEDSGYLRFMDIMNLRLKAEVVTLSGCDTAGGKPTRGEGFQGLVRAFLFAGAENVIAAAWRVPDKATAELLPGVYKSLLDEELASVEALRQAKLRYLESVPASTPEKAHPYYWGAWMLWGTGVKPEK